MAANRTAAALVQALLSDELPSNSVLEIDGMENAKAKTLKLVEEAWEMPLTNWDDCWDPFLRVVAAWLLTDKFGAAAKDSIPNFLANMMTHGMTTMDELTRLGKEQERSFVARFLKGPCRSIFATVVYRTLVKGKRPGSEDKSRRKIKRPARAIETKEGQGSPSDFCKPSKRLSYIGHPDLGGNGMYLDQDHYFFKPIGCDFPQRGHSSNFGCTQMLLRLNVMSDALNDQELELIEFPHAIYEDNNGQGYLVFNKLDHDDYEGGPFAPGLPDPADKNLWDKWLLAVERAFFIIHNKGKMVHVDPYPSNIMWRVTTTGEVQVKIIDWDSLHQHNDEWALGIKEIAQEIANKRKHLGWKKFQTASLLHDLQYLKVLRCLEAKTHATICEGLASGDASKINAAFRQAADTINISMVGNQALLGYR